MDVPSSRMTVPRAVVNYLVLTICAGLGLHIWGVEPFEVPTGSMAPALRGHHRACACPACGFEVVVGRHAADADGSADHAYRSFACPNCGTGVGLEQVREATGDRVLVNKSVFAFRQPRRWEVIVFRRNGKLYIKRVLGLPGEEIEIRDGDIFIDGELARKTLEEIREARVLLRSLTLPARQGFEKCGVLTSEYTYNGKTTFRPENIHDFCIDCDVQVRQGQGSLRLGLTDGQDEVIAELPVGRAGKLVTWMRSAADFRDLPPPTASAEGIAMPGLEAGRSYKVELAFIDRRLQIALDGKMLGIPVDLPAASRRRGVQTPTHFEAHGCEVEWKSMRLYRDLHYTQSGTNAVAGNSVRLQVDQYFVLGDNSGNSEDSRFWPEGGAIHARDLVGKPFLVYLPCRTMNWTLLGRSAQTSVPDVSRIRWLR